MSPEEATPITPTDFIREAVKEDLKSGRFTTVQRAFRRSRTAICTSATPKR